jgi:hypothetical protein
LVKFDFLGLATLTILELARDMIVKRHKGQENFAFENIPLNDVATYKLFADGRTDSGGSFVAHPTHGADHDRLYALMERFSTNFTKYATNTDGIRAIPVLRLTPEGA